MDIYMISFSLNEAKMSTEQPIPAPHNDTWGFWGTMNAHANAAWPLAMAAISGATGQPLESVRAFLDSRHGRYFGDEVVNNLHAGDPIREAIKATTQRWMAWTIRHQTSKDYDIPRGIPYLTGFVIHCTIADEAFTN